MTTLIQLSADTIKAMERLEVQPPTSDQRREALASPGAEMRNELEALVAAYDAHGGRWPQHHEYALRDAVEHARAVLAATPDGPAVLEGREPASVVSELSDEELLEQLCKPLTQRSDYRAGYQAGLDCAERGEVGP